MSEPIKLVIYGDPIAQKRHRSARVPDGIRNYDPSKAKKNDLRWVVQEQRPEAPFDQPLRVDITFFFGRPKYHYGSGKNSSILKPSAPYWHTAKPDRDNLDKFVLDSMKGIFWRDDSIICDGEIRKIYADVPRTEIIISFL